LSDDWILIESTKQEQDNEPRHPWEDITFSQIEEEMMAIRYICPKFSDFKWEMNYKSFGYGAMNYWWELKGKI